MAAYRTISALVVASLGSSILPFSSLPAFSPQRAAAEETCSAGITVQTRGESESTPDLVEFTVGVTTESNQAAEALSENSAAVKRLFKTLEDAHVLKRDVRTQSVTLNPRYNYKHEPATIDGYQASNTISVRVRDIENAGAILDTLARAGANQVQSIQFDFQDPETVLDQARKNAMAEARRKATMLAQEAGVALGSVCSIVEQRDGGGQIYPMQQNRMRAASAEMAVPIAPGSQKLGVALEVNFKIK